MGNEEYYGDIPAIEPGIGPQFCMLIGLFFAAHYCAALSAANAGDVKEEDCAE